MKMDSSRAMSFGNLLIIDLGQPIISRNSTRIRQDETADRISHRRIFLDAPVIDMQIVIDNPLVIEKLRIGNHRLRLRIDLVYDLDRLRSGLGKQLAQVIVGIVNGKTGIYRLVLEIGGDMQRKKI